LLGTFGAGGLQPGTYQVRIMVIGVDGNHLQASPPVPLNVSGQ
jgi:hypothetical protein